LSIGRTDPPPFPPSERQFQPQHFQRKTSNNIDRAIISPEKRFAKQVAEETEAARLLQEKLDAEKKAEAAKLLKKKKGKK